MALMAHDIVTKTRHALYTLKVEVTHYYLAAHFKKWGHLTPLSDPVLQRSMGDYFCQCG